MAVEDVVRCWFRGYETSCSVPVEAKGLK